MQAVDAQVINQLVEWLEAGRSCWLATVVATWGSSPRPVGSLLGCNSGGDATGSLSGGCVEDELLEQITAGNVARRAPQLFRYGVTAEESERLGLPCGGHLDVIVEPLNAGEDLEPFRRIAARLAERRCMRRTLHLEDGRMRLEEAAHFEKLSFDDEAGVLRQTFGPRYHLFMIGAGMVSQYLAAMAQMLDFAVTVCDPRRELLDGFTVAGACRVHDMPDDAIQAEADDPMTAIVALTHDPRIDDMGLLQALKSDAFYIGAMGSARTSAARRERLRALGMSDAEIERLHAPIGLPIGSKTPPEIAIAILAEITAIRHGRERQSRERLEAVSAS